MRELVAGHFEHWTRIDAGHSVSSCRFGWVGNRGGGYPTVAKRISAGLLAWLHVISMSATEMPDFCEIQQQNCETESNFVQISAETEEKLRNP
jgi:hypothetical protein